MSIRSVDPMESTGALLNLISKKQKIYGEKYCHMDTPVIKEKTLILHNICLKW